MKLRSHLVTIVLAVLVPMIAFAAIVVALFGRQRRADVEGGAVQTARALINAVDESLNASVSVLEALATSRNLDDGNLRDFYPEARRVLTSRPDWLVVILFAPDGRQLLNTSRALGEALPPSLEPASVRAVVETRRPASVALTAYGRTQDRTQSLTAGFSMHVPKPVDPGEFTAIVASLAARGPHDERVA
jgi:CheY-like chemotaxis protein